MGVLGFTASGALLHPGVPGVQTAGAFPLPAGGAVVAEVPPAPCAGVLPTKLGRSSSSPPSLAPPQAAAIAATGSTQAPRSARARRARRWPGEDEALRGRERGEVAGLVAEGVRTAIDEGSRCKQVEVVLTEIEAVRHAMSRANKGDLVVLCVDKHPSVMSELEQWSQQAQAGSGTTDDKATADPDYQPTPAE